MEHQLSEATAVKETFDYAKVNELLSEGWTLHSMWPDQSKTRYVLVKF
ncbi:hypothetical protein [Paenibacillus lactis]|uniref:DUF4177 domain-containing protein n=1 Tax=Paenibacillus lactis TaxID=228574 RepID=A0ABS4F9V2_9BACL|nr:hypothetical protein [Paenibacillus lactis]MBP1893035.1 hypothetical protein [Paenibacillus lactis]